MEAVEAEETRRWRKRRRWRTGMGVGVGVGVGVDLLDHSSNTAEAFSHFLQQDVNNMSINFALSETGDEDEGAVGQAVQRESSGRMLWRKNTKHSRRHSMPAVTVEKKRSVGFLGG